MSHLLPSRSLRGGFLLRMLSGLGFLLGMGDFAREDVCDDDRLGAEGAGADVRRVGFLWVISDLSTLRSPEVTLEPREIWSKTAPMSEEPDRGVLPFGAIGGGSGRPSNEGRGGGGGGPIADFG